MRFFPTRKKVAFFFQVGKKCILGATNIQNENKFYSFVLSYALLKVPYSIKLQNIIESINLLTKPIDDNNFNLITLNYSEKGKEKRNCALLKKSKFVTTLSDSSCKPL